MKEKPISLSDTNVDLSCDYSNPDNLSTHQRAVIPIFRLLQDHILNNGAAPIPTKPTKTYVNKPNTWIDHCITNKPQMISGHQITLCGYSDNLILTFYRKLKKPACQPRFNLCRDLKNIDWKLLESEINMDPKTRLAVRSDEPTIISHCIRSVINEHLDEATANEKSSI